MARFVLDVHTDQEFGFEDVQYALVEITPDDARCLIARCELAERLRYGGDGEEGDDCLYALEYWWSGPRYFPADQAPEGIELPEPGDHLRVTDEFEIMERTEADEAAGHYGIRTELDCVAVTPRVGASGTAIHFTATVDNTDCGIVSCELPIGLLREVAAEGTG